MSEISKARFIDLCIRGEARPADIDDFVDRWHQGRSNLELHDFLGMTWDEYSAWVRSPNLLPLIISAHREGRSLKAG